MRYTAEYDGLLIPFRITHGGHRVVSKSEQPLREWCVFDAYPSLLIEEEQVDVVEEWRTQVFADLVVSATDDQKCLVTWEEGHLVTDSAAWWITLLFDLLPFCRHDFSLNAVWLEIFKLCQELAFGVLSTEVINAIEDGVRL